MAKDTIYLEAEDEITTVIDKLQSSQDKVVALVLPKRATVFHSSINVKLLKKAATKAKKSVVLITADPTIVSMAAIAGMHVAKSLHSKPVLPKVPQAAPETEDAVTIEEPEAAAAPTVAAAADTPRPTTDDVSDTIELDNTDKTAGATTAAVAVKAAKPNKKLKIPDFSSFRARLFLAGFAVVLLLFGSVMAFVVMPKATIVVRTDTRNIDTKLSFTASTDVKEADLEKASLPASLAEVSKTDTEKVAATGEKNIGTKADGVISAVNCNKMDQTVTLPAGTTFSAGGFNFVTTEEVSIAASNFFGNGTCKEDKTVNVAVIAAEAGDSYNLSARSYISSNPDVTGDGSAMTGGTNNIVKVVTDQDVENAKAKLAGKSKNAALEEIKTQLQSLSLQPLTETLSEQAPAITANPAVGAEATEVTVTAVTKYSMLGVSTDSIKQMLEAAIKKQITSDQQLIQDNGLDKATYRVTEKKSNNVQVLSLDTVAVVGPNIDKTALAEQSAGKKRGEIEDNLGALPGVESVSVKYSPFWVTQTPKAAKKIVIVTEQSEQ